MKARIDEFGGGAVVIDFDTLEVKIHYLPHRETPRRRPVK